MILGGDELGRTQRGNNNAYAQDNDVSWVDWKHDAERERFLSFVERLTAVRRELSPLRRLDPVAKAHGAGTVGRNLAWFRFDGHEMRWDDWIDPVAPALGLRLFGRSIPGLEQPIGGLLGCFLAFNASESDLSLTLPVRPIQCSTDWTWAMSTDESGAREGVSPARSVTVYVLRSLGS